MEGGGGLGGGGGGGAGRRDGAESMQCVYHCCALILDDLQFLRSIVPYNPPESHVWKTDTLQLLTACELQKER